MEVFICWSGKASNEAALAISDWLPLVVQGTKPFVSTEDISKGTRWSTEVSDKLNIADFGIVCLTLDNLDAPWVNFEAGALSRSVDSKSKVAPILLGVKPSELQGPLSQFQVVTPNRDEFRNLVDSINKCGETPLVEEAILTRLFDKFWPELDEKLKSIEVEKAKSGAPATISADSSPDAGRILEQIITLNRDQSRMLSEIISFMQRNYPSELLTQHVGSQLIAQQRRAIVEHATNIAETARHGGTVSLHDLNSILDLLGSIDDVGLDFKTYLQIRNLTEELTRLKNDMFDIESGQDQRNPS